MGLTENDHLSVTLGKCIQLPHRLRGSVSGPIRDPLGPHHCESLVRNKGAEAVYGRSLFASLPYRRT